MTWRIRDGLLVARAGRGCGFLAVDVRRLDDGPDAGGLAKLRTEVELANFYSAIAVGFSMPVYEATQSAIHVLVTHAFLRSLAKLRLARSRVGRLRWLTGAQAVATAAARARRPGRDGESDRPAGSPPDRPERRPAQR